VFNGKPRSSHEGADLAAPAGAPVAAPGPGRVALAEELYFSGGTVILDHGAGLFTMYFHLSRIDVKAGEDVDSGGRIGAVGATGRATGPHLHWGARLNRARINPLGLLKLPAWPLNRSDLNLTSQSK
jgi:murein DD-endopeptidase MepM/ murein hydrolase activator NlpD